MKTFDRKTNRPSILAPAGSKASFLAAIAAGADAVYCGLKVFSARMEAKNFTVEELIALARLAREKGSEVYVALNALVKPGELDKIGNLLRQVSQKVKPDAIIVQDFSLIQLAKQTRFRGEIHLSTLANVSFPQALNLARKLGVHRVVVPRELDVDEIKTMATACPKGLSLEVFVHGALCYGVSGRCYWSSYLGGKSGLRGRCVQPCRRLYRQKDQKKRFFSCQDLSIDVLVKVLLPLPQVQAWKIEGRKKGPHYVYHAVKAYQLLRDHGSDARAKKEALGLLAMSLGRPGTHYRFLPQRIQDVVKTSVQTGSGLLVGKTKGPQRRPFFISREKLLRGDTLRLGYEDESWHQVHKVKKYVPKRGRLDLPLTTKGPSKKGTPVFLVDRRDKKLQQTLSQLEEDLLETVPVKTRQTAFIVRYPKKARQKIKPFEFSVYRKIPEDENHGKPGGQGLGIWLSPENLSTTCETKNTKPWWWLPPVVWPKDQDQLKELVRRVLKMGGKDFVLNAPWQRGLFTHWKKLNLWAGPFCNLANDLAINSVASLGCSGAIVSPELGGHDFLSLPRQSVIPLGIVLSGNWPLSIARTKAEELKENKSFISPKGEKAWVKKYGSDYWIYPNWRLDITPKKEDLRWAGYRLFVHLIEPMPKGMAVKKRPGLWNWDLDLP